MVLHIMLVPPQHGWQQHHSPRQDNSEGKSSQWAEVQPVHLAVLFVWIESWSEVKILTD